MQKIKFLTLILALLTGLSAFSAAHAQDDDADPVEAQNFQGKQPKRPLIIQALGLSREQVQQLRQINRERRPIMQRAQRRWRLAQNDLDEAIYADNPNEKEIQTLLKEAQTAHSILLKERSTTEFMIRQVLTPEQLQKFRTLREQFRPALKNPENRNDQPERPLNRLRQRRNQLP